MKRIIIFLILVFTAAVLSMGFRTARGQELRYVVKAPVLDVRRSPADNAERVTQVLYNERLNVMNFSGDWAQVMIPDQLRSGRMYPGWVRSANLRPARTHSLEGGSWAVVNVPKTVLYDEYSTNSRKQTVYFGTYFRYVGYRESESQKWQGKPVYWLQVETRDGEQKWLFYYHADIRNGSPFPLKPPGQALMSTAGSLVGSPYLWGGMTRDGIDCSGYTYMVYRYYGYTIPRDADDQFLIGESVGSGNLLPGDLVFFGKNAQSVDHVGIYAGDGHIFHAGSSTGVVYAPLYSGGLYSRYLGARRITGR